MQPSLAAAVRVQALLQEAGEEIEHLRGVRARYRAVLNVVTDMQTSGRLPDEDRKAIAAIINGPLAAALGVAEQPEGRVPE